MEEILRTMLRSAIRVLIEAIAEIDANTAKLIGRLDTVDGKVIRQRLANAGIARAEIERILKSMAPKLSAAMESSYQDLYDESIKIAARDPVMRDAVLKHAPEIARDVVRFAKKQEQIIVKEVTDLSNDAVSSAIRRAILGGTPILELSSEISASLKTTRSRAATTIERGIRELSERTMKEAIKAAEQDLDVEVLYLYVGPDDKVTRKYCDDRLGKVLTQKQADALDPRERYNCRHSISPITEPEVRRRGLKRYTP